MWMEIFLHGYSLVYNANEDVRSRIHGKQVTETARKLFHKDSMAISEIVIDRLIKASDEKNNYLYLFAKRNAKYSNREVVKTCLKKGKCLHLLKPTQVAFLRLQMLFGFVRPTLRKTYYRFLVKPKRNERN